MSSTSYNEYLENIEKLDEGILYLRKSLNINSDNKIILTIIERMEHYKKDQERKYRVCFWDEMKYIKAKHEIYNKVSQMKNEGITENNKDEYFRLLYEYKTLHEEQQELIETEKRAKKEAKKITNRLWKEQPEAPIKSFCVSAW